MAETNIPDIIIAFNTLPTGKEGAEIKTSEKAGKDNPSNPGTEGGKIKEVTLDNLAFRKSQSQYLNR